MACMRAARKRGAKGCVPSGDDARTHPGMCMRGPTDNLARLRAHMTDTIAPPVQFRRPMLLFGPFSLPSPLSPACMPPSRPALGNPADLVPACAPSRAHMLEPPLGCKQKVSRDCVSRRCWSLPLKQPCAPYVTPPTARYRHFLARPCSGLDRGRHVAVELLVRLRPDGGRLQT